LLLHTQFGTYVWSLAVVNIRHILQCILATIFNTNVKEIVTIAYNQTYGTIGLTIVYTTGPWFVIVFKTEYLLLK